MQIGAVLGTLVFVVVGLVLFGVGVYLAWSESQVLDTWDRAQATISYSRLAVDRDSDGTTYRPDIEYKYSMGGNEYTGHCCSMGTSDPGGMQKIVDKNSEGRVVEIFVNPEDSYESRLKEDVAPFGILNLALAGFGAVFSVIGIISFISALRQ